MLHDLRNALLAPLKTSSLLSFTSAVTDCTESSSLRFNVIVPEFVVAIFTLALCAGIEDEMAMYLGNLSASIVIKYFGCYCPTIDDLLNELAK